MPYRLQFADWVPVPMPRVFAFFSNPENLPRLMPPETFTLVDGLKLTAPPPLPGQPAVSTGQVAGSGSIIDTTFRPLRWLWWRRKWTAAITEFEWNHHFADVQKNSPFKHWYHRHEFLAEGRNGFDGTVVRDVIEYELGFGVLGAMANWLFVERRIKKIFAYRQKVLPELLAPETATCAAT